MINIKQETSWPKYHARSLREWKKVRQISLSPYPGPGEHLALSEWYRESRGSSSINHAAALGVTPTRARGRKRKSTGGGAVYAAIGQSLISLRYVVAKEPRACPTESPGTRNPLVDGNHAVLDLFRLWFGKSALLSLGMHVGGVRAGWTISNDGGEGVLWFWSLVADFNERNWGYFNCMLIGVGGWSIYLIFAFFLWLIMKYIDIRHALIVYRKSEI